MWIDLLLLALFAVLGAAWIVLELHIIGLLVDRTLSKDDR